MVEQFSEKILTMLNILKIMDSDKAHDIEMLLHSIMLFVPNTNIKDIELFLGVYVFCVFLEMNEDKKNTPIEKGTL